MTRTTRTTVSLAASTFISTCLWASAAMAAGGTLTVATPALLETPDPYSLTLNAQHSQVYAMFDPLSRIDEEGVVQNYIADSWEQDGDNAWIVRLKKDLKWSDGEPITAEDVVFSTQRIRDPNTNSIWTAVYSYISDVRAVDEHTVRFETKNFIVAFPREFGRMAMLPKHAMEKVSAAEFFRNPVTSGPFKFESSLPGESITLAANKDYHRGAPKADTLVLKRIPNASTRVAEILAGTADLAHDIPPTDVARIEADAAKKMIAYPLVTRVIINFNPTTTPELKDKRVREAAFRSLDADAINNAVYSGQAGKQDSWLDRYSFGYCEDAQRVSYDPARAKELLAEAGYPDGLPIAFTAPTPDYPLAEEANQAIAAQLQEGGFKIDYRSVEFNIYNAEKNGGKLPGIDVRGSANSTGDPGQILRSFDPKREDKQIFDENLEKMIDAQFMEKDPEARAKIICETDKYITDNFLGMNLLTVPGLDAAASNVSGYVPSPFGIRDYSNISVE